MMCLLGRMLRYGYPGLKFQILQRYPIDIELYESAPAGIAVKHSNITTIETTTQTDFFVFLSTVFILLTSSFRYKYNFCLCFSILSVFLNEFIY